MRKFLIKIIQKQRRKRLSSFGKNVSISKNCNLQGNIHVGSNVVLGYGSYFVSTRANIYIHDNVIFGPNVTIYTGDHPVRVIGKHICEVTDADKDEMGGGFDKDVVIEEGCWIGTRAIILKGVTIGKGSIIGAGAIVTKDVPPYSIYIGVPSAKTIPRFTEEEIERHERILSQRKFSEKYPMK